jgi:ribosomal protein L33
MSYQNDKVTDIIAVLSTIEKQYTRNSNYRNTTELRKEAVNMVAESELRNHRYKNWDSAQKTIHDACARRLRPDIADIEHFDKLVDNWLRQHSKLLRDVLLKHSEDRAQRAKVNQFFQVRDQPRNESETESLRPPKLYKYRSLAGDAFRYTQAVLTRSELYCSRLSDFNDPFEGCFSLVMPLDAPVQQRQYEQWSNQLANSLVQRTAAVCSLAEKDDDILMWAHYADRHCGICIEFDPSLSLGFSKDLAKVRYLRNFKEVEHGATPSNEALMKLVCTACRGPWYIPTLGPLGPR